MPAFLQTRIGAAVIALGVGLILGISGCGGDDEGGGDSGGDDQSSSSGGAKGSGSAKKSVAANAGRPEIDGIPLDVFFPEPLAIANDRGEVGGVVRPDAVVQPDEGGAKPEEAAAPEAGNPGGDISWDKLITADLLKSEMKSVRNQLQQRLTALNSYNSSTLEIPVFSTDMALMAEIARRHPEDISWKENAKYISALTARMIEVTSSANARGRKSFDEVKKAFQSICDILDGNTPPDLPEAEEADYVDVADMGYLMKRLQLTRDWMQNNVGNEDNFAENQEAAQREAAVLAAFAQVFVAEGYGYADDEEFAAHSFQMRDAATGMLNAASAKNFTEFDLLRSKATQKCDECHRTYRTGS